MSLKFMMSTKKRTSHTLRTSSNMRTQKKILKDSKIIERFQDWLKIPRFLSTVTIFHEQEIRKEGTTSSMANAPVKPGDC